jgi:MFS family permease
MEHSDAAYPLSRSIGPIGLSPGITPGNAFSLIVCALIGVSVTVFIGFLQPYLLTTQLHVSPAIQGRIVGSFSMMQEVVSLLLVPIFGHLSDRIGRRPIMASGLLVFTVGLCLFPLAGSIPELVVARLTTAVGTAAFFATLATLAVDYTAEKSRGKFLSLLLVTQQLAILLFVAKVAGSLPQWLAGFGISPIDAGHYSFWMIAALAAIGSLVAVVGLSRDRRVFSPGEPAGRSVVKSLNYIVQYAKRHPRFVLVLAIAFVVRGDASIVGSFLSLWSVNAARHQGLEAAAGLQTGGMLLGYATISGLTGAAIAGWLCDRLNRLTVLMVMLGISACGHLATSLISDLQSYGAAFVVCLMGGGESGIIVVGQTLLGQEAPRDARGAAVGVFGFCGSIGVLSINLIGGTLFDRVAFQSPFILIGLINILIFIWALILRSGRHGVFVTQTA